MPTSTKYKAAIVIRYTEVALKDSMSDEQAITTLQKWSEEWRYEYLGLNLP